MCPVTHRAGCPRHNVACCSSMLEKKLESSHPDDGVMAWWMTARGLHRRMEMHLPTYDLMMIYCSWLFFTAWLYANRMMLMLLNARATEGPEEWSHKGLGGFLCSLANFLLVLYIQTVGTEFFQPILAAFTQAIPTRVVDQQSMDLSQRRIVRTGLTKSRSKADCQIFGF